MSYRGKHIYRSYTLVFLILCVLVIFFSGELGVLRGILGDICIILLLFCGAKSIAPIDSRVLISVLLGIAFVLEGLQYIDFLDFIPWGEYRVVQILLGATYDPLDFISYSIGGISALMLERYHFRKKN